MPGMLNQQLFTANYEAQKTASELMGRLDLTQQLWHCAQKRLSCNNKWKVVFFLFKAPTLWKTSSLCVWFVKERRIWLAPQFESRGINWRATSTNKVMENDLEDERFPECGLHRLKRRKKRIMKIIIFLQTNRALFYTAFPPIFVGKRDRNKSKLSFNLRLYSQGVHVFFLITAHLMNYSPASLQSCVFFFCRQYLKQTQKSLR